MGSADFVALKEQHNIFDLFLVLPAGFDPFCPHFSNTGNFDQFFRCLIDNIQRIFTEFFHDLSCKNRPDPFDKTGPKIFFNAIYSGRKCFFKPFHTKLPAVFGIHFPEAFQRQDRAHMGIRHSANYCYQITVVFHCAF